MARTRSPPSVLDRLRRPEYTGENRCTPCTAVNILIAAGISVGVGVVWPPAGVIALVVSLAAIYFRGYLIPGTPTLTKRYFPDWLLRRFDKEPAPDTTMDNPDELEGFLLQADVLEPCRGGEDICLTPGFREAWHARIHDYPADADRAFDDGFEVTELFNVDPDRVSLERHGDAMVASVDDVRIAQWESHAAYVADVAAAEALRGRHAAWERLDFPSRSRVLGGLRLWLDRCPACDGAIQLDQETVESCCRSKDVIAATCQDCDTRLMEAEYAGDPTSPTA